MGSQEGGRFLYGESGGQSAVQAIPGEVGSAGSCVEARGALLCLRAHVPQADTHLDQFGGLEAAGGDGERAVHSRAEVQDGQVERSGQN